MVEEDSHPREVVQDPVRFRRCRWALHVRAEPASGAAEEARYRRCPVGVIAAVDCPEYVGDRCGFHEDRGDGAPLVVPPEEVDALAQELSRDFLTAGYARRVQALRAGRRGAERGAEVLAAFPVDPSPVAAPKGRPVRLVSPGPVNVAPDPVRPPPRRSAR